MNMLVTFFCCEKKSLSKWLVLPFRLTDFGCGYQKYLVILLTFLPGTTISKVPSTPQLLYEAGKTAAKMDTILQNVCWCTPLPSLQVVSVLLISELLVLVLTSSSCKSSHLRLGDPFWSVCAPSPG